jgi:2'-5' RNA ligase
MRIGAFGNRGPRQLGFNFGGERVPPPPPPTPTKRTSDNVYFAILPDKDVARRMREIGEELWHRHGLPGRVQPAHLLHVSLAHVGRFAGVPKGVVAAARMAGSAVRCPSFEVCFDRVTSFDNPRGSPVVVRCGRGEGGFGQLRRAIAGAMHGVGLPANPAIGLTPHVTLVYNGVSIPETMLTKPITWTVREFVLVHSLYGRGRHIHLGRWPLHG